MHLALQPRAVSRPFLHMHLNVLKSAQHPIWHLARALKSNNYTQRVWVSALQSRGAQMYRAKLLPGAVRWSFEFETCLWEVTLSGTKDLES